MPTMSQSQISDFLSSPRHAILATNRQDGPAQLTPVWYLFEDGHFYVSAGAGTAKVANLRRDPRISLCIDGCHPDARYVVVDGEAELVEPGHPRQDEMRRRIIRHYHESEEAADRYYASIKDMPAVLIVVKPHAMRSQDFN